LFEACLSHGAHVCVFQSWIEPVQRLNVSFSSEVDVGQTTLVLALLSYVHFIKLCNSSKLMVLNKILKFNYSKLLVLY